MTVETRCLGTFVRSIIKILAFDIMLAQCSETLSFIIHIFITKYSHRNIYLKVMMIRMLMLRKRIKEVLCHDFYYMCLSDCTDLGMVQVHAIWWWVFWIRNTWTLTYLLMHININLDIWIDILASLNNNSKCISKDVARVMLMITKLLRIIRIQLFRIDLKPALIKLFRAYHAYVLH